MKLSKGDRVRVNDGLPRVHMVGVFYALYKGSQVMAAF